MSVVPHLRFSGHEVWVTLLLLGCLLILAWVRITNSKKILSLVSGFFRSGATEEKNITPDSIALFFIFICTAALLIMQAFPFNGIRTHFSKGEEFLLISIVLLLYYLLKTVLLLLCGAIFHVESSARDYINEIYASAHLAGIGLLPAAIILAFLNNIDENLLEKSILSLVVALFLYRTIKVFILMMNRGLRMIYLFLYLCALEIIPLVLLYEYGKGMNF